MFNINLRCHDKYTLLLVQGLNSLCNHVDLMPVLLIANICYYQTKYIVRIDGDIAKDAELTIRAKELLLEACEGLIKNITNFNDYQADIDLIETFITNTKKNYLTKASK